MHRYAVDSPLAGDYIVRVRALNVAMGPAQPYALVITGSGVGTAINSAIFANGFETVSKE